MKGRCSIFLTKYLDIPMGHGGIEFVDIRTDSDTELFIDPCLVELATDKRSVHACKLFSDFADTLFEEMRSSTWDTTSILDVAHEIHDTKLGYGNGRNGKGKTAEGLSECFYRLRQLANGIPVMSQIQDLSVFVQDFAEDSMSDLLTNILHRDLCRFTQEQMEKYGATPSGIQTITSWDCEKHCWTESEEPFWLCDGRSILLVPKTWVRKNYLFKAHQYLCCVIIEHMKDCSEYKGLPQRDIWKQLSRTEEHWEYERVIRSTESAPDLLTEYHRRMLSFYKRKGGMMTDNDLDMFVYQIASMNRAS